jgi:hypothetical protein
MFWDAIGLAAVASVIFWQFDRIHSALKRIERKLDELAQRKE